MRNRAVSSDPEWLGFSFLISGFPFSIFFPFHHA